MNTVALGWVSLKNVVVVRVLEKIDKLSAPLHVMGWRDVAKKNMANIGSK